jgi:transposase-like protein
VCAGLANRGVRGVLIVCCDGLTGFPEAVAAAWPEATVQACVVHLIRAAMRFVSYQDRKKVAAAAGDLPGRERGHRFEALETFAGSELGCRYPSAVKTWASSHPSIVKSHFGGD